MKKTKYFTENWALIEEDGKFFMAEVIGWKNGERVKFEFRAISNRYDEIGDFNENGVAIVKLDGLYGLVNEKGEEICKPQYGGIRPVFVKYFHAYMVGHESHIIDSKGKVMFECDGICDPDGCEIALARFGKEWAIVNSKCQEINKRRYDDLNFLTDKLLEAKLGNTLIILNYEGKELFLLEYGNIRDDRNGYFDIWASHNFGKLSPEGEVIVPPVYRSVSIIKDGKFTATIEYKGWNGYRAQDYDKNGRKIGEVYWVNY